MAVTKIHAVKATVGRAIDYVLNPKKTDEYALADSFACSLENAKNDFLFSLSHARDHKNATLAFHLIQSFAPGETNPEQAHKIGIELADRIFEGKYSYVIGTHVDKHHIHNHILFCAVDNMDFKK